MLLKRKNQSRAVAAPSVTGRAQDVPRAAIVVPALQHEKWIAEQLESLFRQWRDDLELIFIDDGSTDRSFDIAKDLIASRPDVRATIVKNERPSGVIGVFVHALAYTRAPIIIDADSDDICLAGRINATLECFASDPACKLVTSNAIRISSEGVPLGILDCTHGDAVFSDPVEAFGKVGDERWIGATQAFHRSLIEHFPTDPELCNYGLDLLLAPRAALLGTHHYVAEPLVRWRLHKSNTHRTSGFYDRDDYGREAYEAMELMTMAQRLRDIESAKSIAKSGVNLQATTESAYRLLLDRVTSWSRLKNRIIGRTPPREQPPRGQVPIPPIMTLQRNISMNFGLGPFGYAAHQWTGIHAPEGHWNWTDRRTLLALRAPGAKELIITLRGLPVRQRQSIRFKLGDQDWKTYSFAAEKSQIKLNVEQQGDLFTLQMEAPDALIPAEKMRGNADTRKLGVQLFEMMAV